MKTLNMSIKRNVIKCPKRSLTKAIKIWDWHPIFRSWDALAVQRFFAIPGHPGIPQIPGIPQKPAASTIPASVMLIEWRPRLLQFQSLHRYGSKSWKVKWGKQKKTIPFRWAQAAKTPFYLKSEVQGRLAWNMKHQLARLSRCHANRSLGCNNRIISRCPSPSSPNRFPLCELLVGNLQWPWSLVTAVVIHTSNINHLENGSSGCRSIPSSNLLLVHYSLSPKNGWFSRKWSKIGFSEMCVLPNLTFFIWKVAGQLTCIDLYGPYTAVTYLLGTLSSLHSSATKALHLCARSCHSWPAAMEVVTCHPPLSTQPDVAGKSEYICT